MTFNGDSSICPRGNMSLYVMSLCALCEVLLTNNGGIVIFR